MQGHVSYPEVALVINGESMWHVEYWLRPGALGDTHSGEHEQYWDLDWSIALVTIGVVKVEWPEVVKER